MDATTKQLTDLQGSVLAKLRKRGCDFIAAATEGAWRRGEGYYIDSRVPVSRQLRAEFNKANRQVSFAITETNLQESE
jgi:hypothetical protein